MSLQNPLRKDIIMRGQGRIFTRPNSPNFWCAYYVRGKENRESTEVPVTNDAKQADIQKAKRFLKRRLDEVSADRLGLQAFGGPAQERITVSELLDALESDYRLRNVRSLPQMLSHIKPIRDYFGKRRAVEITPQLVNRYIEEALKEDKAHGTINRSTQLLRQAFKLAVSRRQLNYIPSITRLSEAGTARQGFFERADFDAVVTLLPDYFQDFVRFDYLCGWRSGEMRSLLWSNVDLLGKVIRLMSEDSKNGEPRLLTLEGELWQIIERRKNARQFENADRTTGIAAHVFHRKGKPIGDYRKAWQGANVAAGLADFVCKTCLQAGTARNCPACRKPAKYRGPLVHNFRRTAARNLTRAGVPERVAMSVTGHKTRSIFDRYNIVNEQDIRTAMQKVQNYVYTEAK